MARTVDQINQQIISSYASNMATIGVTIDPTKWSTRNLQRMIIYVVAVAISVFEQVMDSQKAGMEDIVANDSAGSYGWIQQKLFQFQYSATTPQQILFNTTTLVYYYPTVDTTLQIIKRMRIALDNTAMPILLLIYVGKYDNTGALVPLTSAELTASQNYMNTIGLPTQAYQLVSSQPDKLYIQADVYYQGQYSNVILANIQAALNAYLQSIEFTPYVYVSDIERAIKNVIGVVDVVLKNVKARKDSVGLPSATVLVSSTTVVSRSWLLQSGFMVTEATTGNTLADTLNMITV